MLASGLGTPILYDIALRAGWDAYALHEIEKKTISIYNIYKLFLYYVRFAAEANLIAKNAALSACSRAGQWELALALWIRQACDSHEIETVDSGGG